jgi:serine/threonine protein kinase
MAEGPAYASFAPGSVFARLQIEEELGHGPTGTVYRARDATLRRVSAIKVIASDLSRDPGFRERFLREARKAASFGHEHVVAIYDVGEEDTLLYLTMALVDGEDLADLVAREGPLAVESAVEIVSAVAEALEAAHERGLVHGNVKPTNILISREARQVYVVDFGLGTAIAYPRAGRAVDDEDGAAVYLAPEQVAGDSIDARVDVYALGRVLQYALTGGLPSDSPPALQKVVETAVARDPGRRYPSALAFRDALDRAVAHERLGGPVASVTGSSAVDEDEPQVRHDAEVLDDDVQFTVYRPHRIDPGRWYRLLAFAHKSEPFVDDTLGPIDPLEQVRTEAAARLGDSLDEYATTSDDSSQDLPRGSTLTFVPNVDGIEFNPDSRSFRWLEPVHQEEFHMRASPALDGRRARGTLAVYFGSILIAEVNLSIKVGGPQAEPSAGAEHAKPFRRIFVSYSHRDLAVVEQVETFLSIVGDEFMQDIRDLRAGEVWQERIAEMIRSADIFQLYWSNNSMRSEFVQREWMYALSLRRPYFIRPTFWEQPLPALPELDLPPEALRRLHFSYLPGVLRPRGLPAPPPVAQATPAQAPAASQVVFEPEYEPQAAQTLAPDAAPRRAPSRQRRSLRVRGLTLLAPAAAAIGVGLAALTTFAGSGAPIGHETTTVATTTATPPPPTPPTRSSGCQADAGICAIAGHGPGDAGAITGTRGATLRWTSARGRFVLTLDGVVAVNSTAGTGRLKLTRPRYRDASVTAPGAWTIVINRR